MPREGITRKTYKWRRK